MNVLSYGAGVQSTALLVMSNRGDHGVPRADVAIFADTQDEPKWVYDQLKWAQEWSEIPVEVVTAGKLSEGWGGEKRFASIPAFAESGGLLRRQCTREFKITPITKRLRTLRDNGPKVTLMIGISLDEAHRMKPNRETWITNIWPLVDARLNRQECKNYLAARGLPVPKKSSCVYCPYHSNSHWLDMKRNHPAEWSRAVDSDKRIRNLGMKVKETMYLHRTLKPLENVDLQENQIELFGNECEGMCGV